MVLVSVMDSSQPFLPKSSNINTNDGNSNVGSNGIGFEDANNNNVVNNVIGNQSGFEFDIDRFKAQIMKVLAEKERIEADNKGDEVQLEALNREIKDYEQQLEELEHKLRDPCSMEEIVSQKQLVQQRLHNLISYQSTLILTTSYRGELLRALDGALVQLYRQGNELCQPGKKKAATKRTKRHARRLTVDFDEKGNPVGLNAAEFKRSINTYVCQFMPINFKQIGDVPVEDYEAVFNVLMERFNFDLNKRYTKKKISSCYRQHKYKLRSQVKKDIESGIEPQKQSYVKQEDWDSFVAKTKDEEFEKISNKNKANRSQQSGGCRSGRPVRPGRKTKPVQGQFANQGRQLQHQTQQQQQQPQLQQAFATPVQGQFVNQGQQLQHQTQQQQQQPQLQQALATPMDLPKKQLEADWDVINLNDFEGLDDIADTNCSIEVDANSAMTQMEESFSLYMDASLGL